MCLFTTTSQSQVCTLHLLAGVPDFGGSFPLIYSCITDCFNVSQFNTRVKKTACFDHLVQANVRNKKLLKDAVQNITAKGITNYTKGFEFAFEQLSVVKYQVPLFCSVN